MDTITDKELGKIVLIANKRAKKIIVRYRDGYYHLTHPYGTTLSYLKSCIEEMKPRLLKLADKKCSKKKFAPGVEFSTFSFKLELIESVSTQNYYMALKNGILSVSCPSQTDYNDPSVQKLIRDSIEKAFRYEAKRLFAPKVEYFAKKYGFTFSDVKINKSRTRWGSCSAKKSINLSYYCMLLPEHLVDFIILHELCHTIEMNHGERFWLLLDKVTGNRAKELTKELKSYKTDW